MSDYYRIAFETQDTLTFLDFEDYGENPVVNGFIPAKRRKKTEVQTQEGSVTSYTQGKKFYWTLPFIGLSRDLVSNLLTFYDLDEAFYFYALGYTGARVPRVDFIYTEGKYLVEWVNDFEFVPNAAGNYAGRIELREV